MILAVRKHSFEAGHRVLGHESKCANLHGHSYLATIYATSTQQSPLDNLGRVMDFAAIKKVICAWIDENLDHRMILNPHDPLLKIWSELDQKVEPFVMPAYAANPTAENIARVILDEANLQLHMLSYYNHIDVVKVKIQETRNCSAIYQTV